MAMTITIELSDLEEKCMKGICVDPVEWAANAVKARAYSAMHDFYAAEVARLKAEGAEFIPVNVESVVADMTIVPAAELTATLPEPGAV